MIIKCIEIKPGSILLQKKYNWFQRIWARFKKRNLPYNYFLLFGDYAAIADTNSKRSESVLVEPKKEYNKRESKQVLSLVITNNKFEDEWLNSEDICTRDLFTIINTVRPNTVSEDTSLGELLNNKYYNIRELANEQNWDEYIL